MPPSVDVLLSQDRKTLVAPPASQTLGALTGEVFTPLVSMTVVNPLVRVGVVPRGAIVYQNGNTPQGSSPVVGLLGVEQGGRATIGWLQ